jgi:UDP-N-acetylglucosamine/UDP-N-acetyl-alpha-D-glucosaminouronate 4-epimerase
LSSFLITGGAGFIGSNIVEHLVERGESVRVLDDLSTGYLRNIDPFLGKIDFIEGDIRSSDDCSRAVMGVDYVLHLATLPSVPRSVADPLASHEVSTTGTLNLLVAAREASVKRFVFSSSSSVYGDQDAEFKSETLLPMPLSPYAAAKAACEHYLRAFAQCYGLETVSLRFFNVFGPRQDPNSAYSAVIPKFITAVSQGKPPTVHGDGLQARDFTYVENNVRAVVLAATRKFKAAGQVYNIACGTSYTVLDILAEINTAFGTEIAPIHSETRVGDVRLSKADISQARADLKYEVFVPFGEALKRTIDWYREHGSSL